MRITYLKLGIELGFFFHQCWKFIFIRIRMWLHKQLRCIECSLDKKKEAKYHLLPSNYQFNLSNKIISVFASWSNKLLRKTFIQARGRRGIDYKKKKNEVSRDVYAVGIYDCEFYVYLGDVQAILSIPVAKLFRQILQKSLHFCIPFHSNHVQWIHWRSFHAQWSLLCHWELPWF